MGYTPLTSGARATAVGDIITIVLVERTQATKSNSADTSRDGYRVSAVLELFQALEFKSLVSKLPKDGQIGSAPEQGSLGFITNPEQHRVFSQHYQLVNDEKTFTDFLSQLKKQTIFVE